MDVYWMRSGMGLSVNDDSFGVPKHSVLEPDVGCGKLSQKCGGALKHSGRTAIWKSKFELACGGTRSGKDTERHVRHDRERQRREFESHSGITALASRANRLELWVDLNI